MCNTNCISLADNSPWTALWKYPAIRQWQCDRLWVIRISQCQLGRKQSRFLASRKCEEIQCGPFLYEFKNRQMSKKWTFRKIPNLRNSLLGFIWLKKKRCPGPFKEKPNLYSRSYRVAIIGTFWQDSPSTSQRRNHPASHSTQDGYSWRWSHGRYTNMLLLTKVC